MYMYMYIVYKFNQHVLIEMPSVSNFSISASLISHPAQI